MKVNTDVPKNRKYSLYPLVCLKLSDASCNKNQNIGLLLFTKGTRERWAYITMSILKQTDAFFVQCINKLIIINYGGF